MLRSVATIRNICRTLNVNNFNSTHRLLFDAKLPIIDKCHFHNVTSPKYNVLLKVSYFRIDNCQLHVYVDKRLENKLKQKDNIPKDFEIIYRAPLYNYVKVSYYVVFTSVIFITSLLGSAALYTGIRQFPIMVGNMILIHNENEFLGLILAMVVVSVQTSVVVFKYPLRIYTNPDRTEYIAMYQNLLPWKLQQEKFKAGQAKKIKGYMPWKDTLYSLGSRNSILLEDYFVRPSELNLMLGIDNNKEQL